MMRVVIIEDERPAVESLTAMLRKYDPGIVVECVLGGVKESVQHLAVNPQPDLLFMDVQLSDGLSFDILKQCSVECPIIFITAYDEYMIDAFNTNGIDYLLKPVKEERLAAALKKYHSLKHHFAKNLAELLATMAGGAPKARNRVIARRGVDFFSLPVEEAAFFYTEHKIVFAMDTSGAQYVIERTLNELEQELDAQRFFRVNRQFLVNIAAIAKFKSAGKGRIKLELQPQVKTEIVVSQENAAAFRHWMGQ